MNSPGVYNLGDRTITSALTGEVITSGVSAAGVAQELIDRLEGMLAASIQVRFAYGAGGTSCKVYIQTSLDGIVWTDVACAAFATSSGTKIFNLSSLTPKTTPAAPTDGSLTDDTAVDGFLGDRLRVKITSVGTYSANTSISVRASAR